MTNRYPRTHHAHIQNYSVPTANPNVWIDGWEFAHRVKCGKESGEIAAAQMEAILLSKAKPTEAQ